MVPLGLLAFSRRLYCYYVLVVWACLLTFLYAMSWLPIRGRPMRFLKRQRWNLAMAFGPCMLLLVIGYGERDLADRQDVAREEAKPLLSKAEQVLQEGELEEALACLEQAAIRCQILEDEDPVPVRTEELSERLHREQKQQ
jgi:hypothetical protein